MWATKKKQLKIVCFEFWNCWKFVLFSTFESVEHLVKKNKLQRFDSKHAIYPSRFGFVQRELSIVIKNKIKKWTLTFSDFLFQGEGP